MRLRWRKVVTRGDAGPSRAGTFAVRSLIRALISACFSRRLRPTRALPKKRKKKKPIQGSKRITSSHAMPVVGLRLRGMKPRAAIRRTISPVMMTAAASVPRSA